MAKKLTKKQKLILDFITEFSNDNNYSPSYREIMSGLGLTSVSAVAEHIENLVSKGYLKKTPGAARSLEVIDLSFPETTKLFKEKLKICTDDETKILIKAAEILEIDLCD